jgi:hypothetical protein
VTHRFPAAGAYQQHRDRDRSSAAHRDHQECREQPGVASGATSRGLAQLAAGPANCLDEARLAVVALRRRLAT